MGLFSRRRTAVAEATAWRPTGDYPDATPGYLMDDDGCASDEAHGVTFWRADSAALITVWTYASHAGDERYDVGLRYQYTCEDVPDWAYAGYEGDPCGEVYDDLETADSEARDWAASLAAGNPDSMGNLPDVFDWWGEAFPVAAAG